MTIYDARHFGDSEFVFLGTTTEPVVRMCQALSGGYHWICCRSGSTKLYQHFNSSPTRSVESGHRYHNRLLLELLHT